MPEPTEKPLSRKASGTYLAFDYGEKRLGVASGQTVTRSAGPIEIIPVTRGINWNRIEQLVKQWNPVGLIIGVPYTADGKRTAHIKRIHRFLSDMESHFQLPVFAVDERLSSYVARDLLCRSTHRKIQVFDDMAAAAILQTWLDNHNDND